MVAELTLFHDILKFSPRVNGRESQLLGPRGQFPRLKSGNVVVKDIPVGADVSPGQPETKLDFQPSNDREQMSRQEIVGVPGGQP